MTRACRTGNRACFRPAGDLACASRREIRSWRAFRTQTRCGRRADGIESGRTPIRTTSACRITRGVDNRTPVLAILVGGRPASVFPDGMFRAATGGGSPLRRQSLASGLSATTSSARRRTRPKSAHADQPWRPQPNDFVERVQCGVLEERWMPRWALPGAKALGPHEGMRDGRPTRGRTPVAVAGIGRTVCRGRLAAGLGVFVRTGCPSSRLPPRARCPR